MTVSKSFGWGMAVFVLLTLVVYSYALEPRRFFPEVQKNKIVTTEYSGTGSNMQPTTHVIKKTVKITQPHPIETTIKVILIVAWVISCAIFFATSFSSPAAQIVTFVFGGPVAIYILWIIVFARNF